jgi:hypothetical protein
LYRLLEQTFSTDDGRRILREALEGTVTPRRAALRAIDHKLPYTMLGSAPPPAAQNAPIFTTGRFRSGSTLLWNLFRHVPDCVSYYEPLNERRWFDPAARGDRVDGSHLGVTDYWHEYDGLADLSRFYDEGWIRRRLYMSADDWDGALCAFIHRLIASAAPRRAVLQFNRVDFRLPWLRHYFPHARFIHMYRHPRDQWVSSLVRPDSFPADGTMEQFAAHDHFYLLMWARDLSYVFPFLDPKTAEHPYDLFYWIWRLSYWFGTHFCDASFGLEAMCADPHSSVTQLMQVSGVEQFDLSVLTPLIVPQPSKWQGYADQEWFAARESRCDAVLAAFARH